MSEISLLDDYRERRIEGKRENPHDKRNGSGGPGGPDDMEQRVTRLESTMEYMGRDIHEIRRDMVTKEHLESVLNRRALKAALAVIAATIGTLTWLAQVYLGPILERLSG